MNLSPDPSFNFNLLRWIGTAPYRGADIAEVLDLAGRLTPGDFESWHSEFRALAERVATEGWDDESTSSATRRVDLTAPRGHPRPASGSTWRSSGYRHRA